MRSRSNYGVRIGRLRDGAAGGLKASYRLNATTVHDDGAIDELFGEGGVDWFFAVLTGPKKDNVEDWASGEIVTALGELTLEDGPGASDSEWNLKSRTGRRASDKGLLPVTFEKYLEQAAVRAGKRCLRGVREMFRSIPLSSQSLPTAQPNSSGRLNTHTRV